MRSNRQQKRKDKSWFWLSVIAGFFIVFLIVLITSSSSSLRGLETSGPKQSQSSDFLAPKTISERFYPPILKSLIIHPDSVTNYFDFILDAGNGQSSNLNLTRLESEAKQLINYFFLGITLPSEDFWVNLNPVEADKITSPRLTATDLGKVLLEADLILKKDGARLTNPRSSLGREYWDKVSKELKERGLYNGQIPANNRLWIVPAEAIVEEEKDKVTIISAKLKVCLESEYFSQQRDNFMLVSAQDPDTEELQECISGIMKQTVIPEIEYRVNYSKEYAPLRQVYHSLILAEYFKQKYWGKGGLYSRYVNQCYLDGLHSKVEWSKRKIFDAYASSFQNGEYSFYQNEYDPTQLAMVQKHYFSGGITFAAKLSERLEIRTKQRDSVTIKEQGKDQPQIVKAYFKGIVDGVLEEDTSNGKFLIETLNSEDLNNLPSNLWNPDLLVKRLPKASSSTAEAIELVKAKSHKLQEASLTDRKIGGIDLTATKREISSSPLTELSPESIWQIILDEYSEEEVLSNHIELVITRTQNKGLNSEEEILKEYEDIRRQSGVIRFGWGKVAKGLRKVKSVFTREKATPAITREGLLKEIDRLKRELPDGDIFETEELLIERVLTKSSIGNLVERFGAAPFIEIVRLSEQLRSLSYKSLHSRQYISEYISFKSPLSVAPELEEMFAEYQQLLQKSIRV